MDKNTIYMKDFRTLKVWQKSMDFTQDIYRIAKKLPYFEKNIADTASQLVRCTTSISANVAEGCGQLYPKKELSFINNALNSASECRNWLVLVLMNKHITEHEYQQLDAKLTEIIRMLIGYMRKVQGQIKDN